MIRRLFIKTGLFLLFPVLAAGTGFCADAGGGEAVRKLSPLNDMMPEGYYEAERLSSVDPDLNPGNIKFGVSIFGITGILKAKGYGMPRTGQQLSWQPRDDGSLQKGFSSGERFTDNGNNTVTDNATGLIWIKDHTIVEAGSYRLDSAYDWDSALLAVSALNLAGYTWAFDWRLPNVMELESIVDYGAANPCVDTGVFPGTKSDPYWSSTTYADDSTHAWLINFYDGYLDSYSKSEKHYIRPVRGPKL